MKICTGICIFKLCLAFASLIGIIFSTFAIDKWRQISEYDETICYYPYSHKVIKTSAGYYRGSIDINCPQDESLIKLFFPAMYSLLAMTDIEDVTNWVNDVYNKTKDGGGITCYVDYDDKIGVTNNYQKITEWATLFIVCAIFSVILCINFYKERINTRRNPDNIQVYINSGEVPPMYEPDNPPDYKDRESYDRTPPTEEDSASYLSIEV